MLESLIKNLRTHQPKSMECFVAFLLANNIPWKFYNNIINPGSDCVAICRWCRLPCSFRGTPELIKQFSNYSCTSCTPSPSPALIIKTIIANYHHENDLFQELCITVETLKVDNDYDRLYEIVTYLVARNHD